MKRNTTGKNNEQLNKTLEFVMESIEKLEKTSKEIEQLRDELNSQLNMATEMLADSTDIDQKILELYTQLYLGNTSTENAVNKLRRIAFEIRCSMER